MTCVHCSEKIHSELIKAEGVISAEVSYGKGVAEIEYDADIIGLSDITALIESLGYEVIPDSGREKSGLFKLIYPFIVFSVIVVAFVLLQYFGLLNYLAPTELAESGMGYGTLFVIGLITSVHCIAMCGGINLSQCIPKSENDVQKGLNAIVPALFYNLGRVISYTAIGFVLGFIGWVSKGGASVGISLIIQGVFKIAAGVLMIIMGVNMLGIIPFLRRLNPKIPKFLAKKIGKKKSSATNPFIVGILNGIMPCGPLQSMWIVALATGNPFSGALSMLMFALGTVPLMLGLGSVVAKLGQKFTKTIMTVGSTLVVVLGLAMLSQGGSLTGYKFLSPTVLSAFVLSLIFAGIIFSYPVKAKTLQKVMSVASCCIVVAASVFAFRFDGRTPVGLSYDVSEIDGDKQIVISTLDSGSYPNISVTKNIPVEWIIVADDGSINGCNYKIFIPEYGIEYVFHTGENVIEFVPDKSGSFNYSCWMGMIHGNIKVTD